MLLPYKSQGYPPKMTLKKSKQEVCQKNRAVNFLLILSFLTRDQSFLWFYLLGQGFNNRIANRYSLFYNLT